MASALDRVLGFRPKTLPITVPAASAGSRPSFQVTHEELAESVGSSREVISRTLGHLRRAGAVGAGPGRVQVLDLDGLAAIVEGLVE